MGNKYNRILCSFLFTHQCRSYSSASPRGSTKASVWVLDAVGKFKHQAFLGFICCVQGHGPTVAWQLVSSNSRRSYERRRMCITLCGARHTLNKRIREEVQYCIIMEARSQNWLWMYILILASNLWNSVLWPVSSSVMCITAVSNVVTDSFWKTHTNRREFFENYAKARGFDPLKPPNWYRTIYVDLKGYKVYWIPR